MPASGTTYLANWPSLVWDGSKTSALHSIAQILNPQMVTALHNYQRVVIWATHLGFPIPALKIQEHGQSQESALRLTQVSQQGTQGLLQHCLRFHISCSSKLAPRHSELSYLLAFAHAVPTAQHAFSYLPSSTCQSTLPHPKLTQGLHCPRKRCLARYTYSLCLLSSFLSQRAWPKTASGASMNWRVDGVVVTSHLCLSVPLCG